MQKIALTIIIPTLNEEKHLGNLLSCLQKQTYQGFQVLVADADSTDGTTTIAKQYGAKLVPGGIQAIGRNNGSELTDSDLIMFIDADVTVRPDFLEKSLIDFEKKGLEFAVPYFKNDHERLKFKIFYWYANLYKFLMQFTRFPDGTGQLILAQRKAFWQLGGFREFLVAEDTDLFWRAARKKYKVGTINTRFNSSTRRLEKNGILWTLFVWSLIGVFMMLGILHRKKVQKFAAKLYDGVYR